jgi:hypothetical protein
MTGHTPPPSVQPSTLHYKYKIYSPAITSQQLCNQLMLNRNTRKLYAQTMPCLKPHHLTPPSSPSPRRTAMSKPHRPTPPSSMSPRCTATSKPHRPTLPSSLSHRCTATSKPHRPTLPSSPSPRCTATSKPHRQTPPKSPPRRCTTTSSRTGASLHGDVATLHCTRCCFFTPRCRQTFKSLQLLCYPGKNTHKLDHATPSDNSIRLTRYETTSTIILLPTNHTR